MINNLDELKKILKEINDKDINFIPYFYTKKEDRPDITDEFVKEKIKDIDNTLGFQYQIVKEKERYRIGIKLSNKYKLVVIAEIKEKGLNIITAWKTSRKWQKAIQK